MIQWYSICLDFPSFSSTISYLLLSWHALYFEFVSGLPSPLFIPFPYSWWWSDMIWTLISSLNHGDSSEVGSKHFTLPHPPNQNTWQTWHLIPWYSMIFHAFKIFQDNSTVAFFGQTDLLARDGRDLRERVGGTTPERTKSCEQQWPGFQPIRNLWLIISPQDRPWTKILLLRMEVGTS